ncbi:SDR family NAD(P)-dependent oxidoreductase [Spongiactinospora sp. TRM90649]|uniref:SDR family oxidoreductase n=1 Tax=Spongiactinospora sp. TRM90649 TaxID=3031114 RepID=UPI0023F83C6C|nr:SDR family NAD(P)-dependent oxidoreductase [Spongiactinospora sp. TRM90649]MDF5758298.1 SDR family NAD(P)-dependent oxidoreductase [Spongiactinospora sp. TRM90649]
MTGEPTAHEGRSYLVTGGASGIGRATAEVLAARGARVAIADLDAGGARRTAAELGGHTLPVTLDVADRDSWQAAVAAVETAFGGLDGLVNNAGITRDRTLARMSDQEWRQVVDVHLRGTWLGCQAARRLLSASDAGSIVNISSSGRHGSFGQTNYAAAKAGVVGLTKTVALELARAGVRCNAVAPGAVDTPMIRDVPEPVRENWLATITLGRLARPREIAEVVAFLLSPAASYITAQVIDVNGGELHL